MRQTVRAHRWSRRLMKPYDNEAICELFDQLLWYFATCVSHGTDDAAEIHIFALPQRDRQRAECIKRRCGCTALCVATTRHTSLHRTLFAADLNAVLRANESKRFTLPLRLRCVVWFLEEVSAEVQAAQWPCVSERIGWKMWFSCICWAILNRAIRIVGFELYYLNGMNSRMWFAKQDGNGMIRMMSFEWSDLNSLIWSVWFEKCDLDYMMWTVRFEYSDLDWVIRISWFGWYDLNGMIWIVWYE